MELSVATFNILSPYHAVKWAEPSGLNSFGQAQEADVLKILAKKGVWRLFSNWSNRQSELANQLKMFDLVCVQEISPHSLRDLQGVGLTLTTPHYHLKSPHYEVHGNVIVYNPKVLSLIAEGSFEFEKDDVRRGAVWADFLFEKIKIRVVSLHLKGFSKIGDPVSEPGYNELLFYESELEKLTSSREVTIIGGDFNDPNQRPDYLRQKGFKTLTEKGSIDWLFVKGRGELSSPQIFPGTSSDHPLISVKIKFS